MCIRPRAATCGATWNESVPRSPFVKPATFPQHTLLASRAALIALDEEWGEDFCRAVYTAEFGEGRDIGEAETVVGIMRDLGQDADRLLAQAQSDAVKARLRGQCEEAQALGIFGAPSFVTRDGELFWGNDRLEMALEWVSR